MAKGLDSKFLHYGIRKDNLSIMPSVKSLFYIIRKSKYFIGVSFAEQ